MNVFSVCSAALACSIVTARIDNGEPAKMVVDVRGTLYALSLFGCWHRTVKIELVPAVAQLSIDDDPRQMDPPLMIIAGGGMGSPPPSHSLIALEGTRLLCRYYATALCCTLVSQRSAKSPESLV